jgi:hypothetical protein
MIYMDRLAGDVYADRQLRVAPIRSDTVSVRTGSIRRSQLPPGAALGTPRNKAVSAVYSPKGSRDALFLSNFAQINMLDILKRIPGVGDAALFGPLDYSNAGVARPRPHGQPWGHRAGCRRCA